MRAGRVNNDTGEGSSVRAQWTNRNLTQTHQPQPSNFRNEMVLINGGKPTIKATETTSNVQY